MNIHKKNRCGVQEKHNECDLSDNTQEYILPSSLREHIALKYMHWHLHFCRKCDRIFFKLLCVIHRKTCTGKDDAEEVWDVQHISGEDDEQ